MQYMSFFFEGLLILIIIGFIVRNIGLSKKVSKLELEKWQQESYYQTLLHQNEVLKSYMDNRHMVWNIELGPSALKTMENRTGMVVLMNGQEALDIWDGRYDSGWHDALRSGGYKPRLQKEEPAQNVVKLQPAIDDRRFDGDYRDHVNSLTDIAVRFAGTQQLRSRISSQVLNFREYMKKRLSGEKPNFPKEN